MTVTFADPIVNAPCKHMWKAIGHLTWRGRNYQCIYCGDYDFLGSKLEMTPC